MFLGALVFLPTWPHRVDRGILVLVAALFLATILAHRYWRAKIRLEDALEAREKDAARAWARYRQAFRLLPHPAAFVDRATGLVMETAPGWEAQGLPAAGASFFGEDPGLEATWRAIPAPDAQGRPGLPVELALGSAAFRALPLEGPSLGVVLVVKA